MRVLEMGKLSPAVQQGVSDGRDVRAEAGLRHQLQARQVQTVRPDREEAAAVQQDGAGRRAVAMRRKSARDDREDRVRHGRSPDGGRQDLVGAPGEIEDDWVTGPVAGTAGRIFFFLFRFLFVVMFPQRRVCLLL